MGKKNKNPPPDPRLVEAQIRSMGYQDAAIQQFMQHAHQMAPLQMEQMRWGLDTSRKAWEQAQEDRGIATGLRNKLLGYAEEDRALAKQIAEQNQAMFLQDRQMMQADRERALADYEFAKRGREKLYGLQSQMLDEARAFNTEQRREELAAQARADVAQQFGLARGTNMRQMQRMGVNPNDGRSLALGNQLALAEAAAGANAANKVRQAARAEGLAMTDRALAALAAGNYSGQAAAALGMAGDATRGRMAAAQAAGASRAMALGAGMPAMSGALSTLGLGMNANNMGAGFGLNGLNLTNSALQGMNHGWAQAASTAGSLGSNAAGMWGAQANYHLAGKPKDTLGGILGGAGGMISGLASAGIISDRRLKTGIVKVGVDAATGLNLYQFHYRDDPAMKEWIGVMADEVQRAYPEAVQVGEDGYMRVDYALLGLEMKEATRYVHG